MIYRGRKYLNKNFLIAGGVVLAIGLAVAIGVTLVDEPLDGNLPEGETTVNGDFLPELSLIHISEPTRQEAISYAVFCLKKKKK